MEIVAVLVALIVVIAVGIALAPYILTLLGWGLALALAFAVIGALLWGAATAMGAIANSKPVGFVRLIARRADDSLQRVLDPIRRRLMGRFPSIQPVAQTDSAAESPRGRTR